MTVYCATPMKLLLEACSKAESHRILWVFSHEDFLLKRSKPDGLKQTPRNKSTAAIYCHLLLYYLLSD